VVLRGHHQIDHTADLAFEVWADDEASLLEEAAHALILAMTEGAEAMGVAARVVELDSLDAEDRLVRFLNEVAVLAMTDGFVTASASVSLHEHGLCATLHGEEDARAKVLAEVKAVTYHDLSLARGEDGLWRARFVVDV
jgi:SHS2 domain-containing protein